MLYIALLFVVALAALVGVVLLIRSEDNEQKNAAQAKAAVSEQSSAPATQQAVAAAAESEQHVPTGDIRTPSSQFATPRIYERETQELNTVPTPEAVVQQTPMPTPTSLSPGSEEERMVQLALVGSQFRVVFDQLKMVQQQTVDQLLVLRQQSNAIERRLGTLNDIIERFEHHNQPSRPELHAMNQAPRADLHTMNNQHGREV